MMHFDRTVCQAGAFKRFQLLVHIKNNQMRLQQERPMRHTIVDVARLAQVSTATVDRVLNERPGVRAPIRERVLAAARASGYLPAVAPVAPAAPTRLDFILQSGPNTFMDLLAGHLTRAAAARAAEVELCLHRVEGFSPDTLAATLRELPPASRGVGLIALDHPVVREAIRAVVARGVTVLTLVSDVANVPRSGYVGIDNRAAGRLAGHLLGRFVPGSVGEVALLAGSLSYRGHEEREMGFRHILADEFPNLRTIQLREVRDDLERSYREAKTLLAAHPGLRGIYNIGAGNRGIAKALEEAGRSREVVFIGHELTEHTRRFLLAGTMDAVIDQNPRVEAREAIDRLLRAARGEPDLDPAPIRIHAIFRENLPEI
jgi:LacI family transcriptional regulator